MQIQRVTQWFNFIPFAEISPSTSSSYVPFTASFLGKKKCPQLNILNIWFCVILECKTVPIFAYSSTRDQSETRGPRAKSILRKYPMFCSLVYALYAVLNREKLHGPPPPPPWHWTLLVFRLLRLLIKATVISQLKTSVRMWRVLVKIVSSYLASSPDKGELMRCKIFLKVKYFNNSLRYQFHNSWCNMISEPLKPILT